MSILRTIRALAGTAAVVLLLALSIPASAQTVTFPDPRLESAVRDALNQPSGDITVADMLTLTELNAGWRGIEDTRGLETAANLVTLAFDGNRSTNASGVAGLGRLASLTWSGAGLRDTAFLAGLHALTNLALNGNPITSFSGFPGLTNLVRLDMNNASAGNLS